VFDATSSKFVFAPVRVTNLLGASSQVWYLQAAVMPTGFIPSGAGITPYLIIKVTGGVGGAQVIGSYNCNPSYNSCAANRNIVGGSAAVPFICTEWLLTPALLDPTDGGSVTVSVSAVGFFSTGCDYNGQSVFVSLDFRGMNPHPTPGPTAVPTALPSLQPTPHPEPRHLVSGPLIQPASAPLPSITPLTSLRGQ
jgi:hypothetical protein